MDVKITIITVILLYSNQITKKLCIVKQEIMCAVKISDHFTKGKTV